MIIHIIREQATTEQIDEMLQESGAEQIGHSRIVRWFREKHL